ncbi:PALLD protein, partial [Pluvianellus socialis]|nr:PALLD protein [Pluvianellus socialis]
MQSPSASLTGSAYGSTPVFTKGLQNIRATKGQLVVFECRIRATPTLQVHWYREYDQITDSADFRILRKSSIPEFVISEEVCTLVITEAFPEDSGIFKCVAENEFGSAASSARLSVSPGAKELESFAGTAHRPAVQVTMKRPTFPRNSQAGAKDRAAAGLPSYGTESPGLGRRAEASNFQMNSKSDTEDFRGAYANSPQASPLRENPHQESLYSARQGFHSIQEPSQESFRGL